MFPEYERYDALGLAALVRDGEASTDELLAAVLERSAARNPQLNAVRAVSPAPPCALGVPRGT